MNSELDYTFGLTNACSGLLPSEYCFHKTSAWWLDEWVDA